MVSYIEAGKSDDQSQCSVSEQNKESQYSYQVEFTGFQRDEVAKRLMVQVLQYLMITSKMLLLFKNSKITFLKKYDTGYGNQCNFASEDSVGNCEM